MNDDRRCRSGAFRSISAPIDGIHCRVYTGFLSERVAYALLPQASTLRHRPAITVRVPRADAALMQPLRPDLAAMLVTGCEKGVRRKSGKSPARRPGRGVRERSKCLEGILLAARKKSVAARGPQPPRARAVGNSQLTHATLIAGRVLDFSRVATPVH